MTFEEALETNGKIVYTNVGISMLPLLKENEDIMIIQPLSSPLKKYDVVLFKRRNIKGRGEYVLHRITKVYNHSYYIIGDNCEDGEMVDEDQILGILTSIQRKNRIINTTDKMYQLSVVVWHYLFPIRMLYRKINRCIHRIGHIIKRKVLKIK